MKLYAIAISLGLIMFPVVTGCKTELPVQQESKTESGAQRIEPVTPQPPSQPPAEAQEDVYIYDQKGRVDPFVPLIETPKKGKQIVTGTLESYDVSDFKLIAIARKGKQHYGLLLTPDNKSYTVREGTVLGMHKGKVKEIMDNKLVIVEYITDYKGELKPRQITLELSKGEE